MNMQKTGGLIAAIRKEKGLTQEQLGEKLYVTGKAVSKWERGAGAPGVELLEPLARELGITVTELLAGERVGPEQLPEKSEEVTLQVIREERLGHKRARFLLAALVLLFAVYVLANNWSALSERGNPLPYLAKMGQVFVEGYAEVEAENDSAATLLTLREDYIRVFNHIENRWDVMYWDRQGRGYKFRGDESNLTVLKDGYLGIFSLWQVYVYPADGT